jgi:hypothetical protein
MLSTERPEFVKLLGALLAGFNAPITDERIEGYWRGLMKLNLIAFERVVEYALGEHGPEKLPTAPGCWNIHRELHSQQRVSEAAPLQAALVPERDALYLHGQRVLLSFLRHKGGTSDAEMRAMLAAKATLLEQYRWILQDEPAAAAELRDKLWSLFEGLHEPRTVTAEQRA